MSDPTLTELELLLLGAVCRMSEERYGVAIRREISERTSRDIAIGSVYRSLAGLERKGFVRSWTGAPTPVRGGRSKRYFEATADGVGALRRTLRDLHALTDTVDLGLEAV